MHASEGTFGGETAEHYARFRRGYPDAVVDAVVDLLGLGPGDLVIDVGCGTGLLSRALAARGVRLVIGVDPEPAMLGVARRSTDGAGSKTIWILGTDADVPSLGALTGERAVGAITVGQALHFMDYERLFRDARALLRPGGGLAVISNGLPLWQQEREWSARLQNALEDWFGARLTSTCGTDPETQARYAAALRSAGYRVEVVRHDDEAVLALEEVVGGVYSAISPGDVPPDRRDAFTDHIARALAGLGPFVETVPVVAVVGITA